MNYLQNIWPQYIPGKYGTFDAHQVTKLTSLSHIHITFQNSFNPQTAVILKRLTTGLY